MLNRFVTTTDRVKIVATTTNCYQSLSLEITLALIILKLATAILAIAT